MQGQDGVPGQVAPQDTMPPIGASNPGAAPGDDTARPCTPQRDRDLINLVSSNPRSFISTPGPILDPLKVCLANCFVTTSSNQEVASLIDSVCLLVSGMPFWHGSVHTSTGVFACSATLCVRRPPAGCCQRHLTSTSCILRRGKSSCSLHGAASTPNARATSSPRTSPRHLVTRIRTVGRSGCASLTIQWQ